MLTEQSPARQRNAMLAVLLVGAFLMLLAETFFNNALPTIIATYRVSQSTAQWVSTGYQLVAGLMIPLSAWQFHNFNLKKTYLTLASIFLTGCLVGFFAPNFPCLLAARLIQAIAAGSMIPLIQNVVLVLYPADKRGALMGTIGLVVAFGPALGPTVGGLIIDSLGFGALLYGFSAIGNAGEVTTGSLVAILVGMVILFWFCRRQLKIENPLIELRVFKNPTFDLATLLSALSNIALLGVELVLPLYLQRVRGLSALDSGLLLLPGAVLEGLLSPVSGKLFDRFGIRPVAIGGFAIVALGTLPMLFFTTHTSLVWVALTYAFRIVGVAIVMMPTFTEGINALSPQLAVHGNAASSTVRQIAGSLGTALLMTMVAFGTNSASVAHASAASRLVHGYWFAFLIAFLMDLLGFVLSFWTGRNKN